MVTQTEAKNLRKFLKHLLIASQKNTEVMQAEKDLKEHIQQIKQKAEEKEGVDVDEEIKALKDKIQKIIDIESKVLYRVNLDDNKDTEIEEHIKRLERKIDKYLEEREKRVKRIEQIEKKIRSSTGHNKLVIDRLEEHITTVEDQLLDLKISGKLNEKKAKEMKEKIKGYKEKVAKAKGLSP